MGYTPTNNPYIPGDPYSYDLKWIVREIKKLKGLDPVDDSIIAALIEKRLSKSLSGDVQPIYMGDWVEEAAVPAAAVKYGDKVWAISAYNTSSNEGTVRLFDLTTNQQLGLITDAKMGHGNSLCYDPIEQKFWIAPVYEYDGGQHTVNHVFRYDKNFSSYDEIGTSTVAMAVAYDHHTKELYYYDYNRDVYKWNGTGWDFYSAVQLISGDITTYNQGFAVCDNVAYLSSPGGRIVRGDLKAGNTYMTSFKALGGMDLNCRFLLGEYQSLCFDENDMFIVTNSMQLTGVYNGFVLQIPTADCDTIESLAYDNSVIHFTLTLSDEAKEEFAQGRTRIRHLAQLQLLVKRPNAITYTSETPLSSDNVEYQFDTDIRINFSATSVWNFWRIYTFKDLILNGENGCSLIANSSAATITVIRGGSLQLMGDLTITETVSGNIASSPQDWCFIIVDTVPTLTSGDPAMINTTTPMTKGLWLSNKLINNLT